MKTLIITDGCSITVNGHVYPSGTEIPAHQLARLTRPHTRTERAVAAHPEAEYLVHPDGGAISTRDGIVGPGEPITAHHLRTDPVPPAVEIRGSEVLTLREGIPASDGTAELAAAVGRGAVIPNPGYVAPEAKAAAE